MFLDGKNQYCENHDSPQCNLQIQSNLYQTTNGIFHRTRANNFTICMESQKTLMLEGIEGRRQRGSQRMRWLDGITNMRDVSLS